MKMLESKKILLTIEVFLVIAAYTANHYLANVCLEMGDCLLSRRDFFLPALYASVTLFVILFPFLLLPAHYFTAYCRRILWWLLPLAFINAAATGSHTNDWISRADMVVIVSVVSAVITLVFIVMHFGREEKGTMRKNLSLRIINYLIVILGFLSAVGIEIYWTTVCAEGMCSYSLMSDFLLPLKYAGISIALIASPFLLLPAHYFTAYCRRILWWLLPLAFLNVASTGNQTSEWIDRADMVIIVSVVSAVITLVFIGVHFWRNKDK